MEFQGNYKFYGTVDVKRLQKLLLELDESCWTDEVAKSSRSHKQSRNLFIKNDIKVEHFYGKFHDQQEAIKTEALSIVEHLRPHLPESYLIRLQFVRHLKGEGFRPHKDDFSFTLMNSHRIHVAIFSENKFQFIVGGEEKFMKEGEVWEINNTRTHSGINLGEKPRISLIACFARPLYKVRERVETFLNLEKVSHMDGFVRLRPRLNNEQAPESIFLNDEKINDDISCVNKGIVVGINYELKDARTNELITKNDSNEPLQFVFGLRQLPFKMESALIGKKINETFSVLVSSEEGYGNFYNELRFKIKDSFTDSQAIFGGLSPKVVAALKAGEGDFVDKNYQVLGNQLPLIYSLSKQQGEIYFDANHPYAGRDFIFSGKIVSLRPLSEDENRFSLYRGATLENLENQMKILKAFNLV